MSSAICNLSLVPVRSEPTDRAEMVTQLLFGELFHIERQEGNWLFITCDFDSYQGWIDVKQCRPVSDAFVEIYNASPSPISTELLQIVFNESRKIAIPVVLGSTLPNFINKNFYIDEDKYSFDGPCSVANNVTREKICETALQYLNSPYLWGGRSPLGIDCSGLVQMVYRMNGYKLRRDAVQQSSQGGQVSFASEAAPGDIAFFENEEGNIIHTGIILPGNKIIHSSGRVKIDDLDHEGIYSHEYQRYTHKLRLIKTIL
jgi:gamma-D-glutamyl-L-lysine dipeptidyl-peptidase